MGMFDSFYDANGNEWQTKALACLLDVYRIGDTIPGPPLATYQVEAFGSERGQYTHTCATIREGTVTSVHDKRDERFPLLDYNGNWIAATDDQADPR